MSEKNRTTHRRFVLMALMAVVCALPRTGSAVEPQKKEKPLKITFPMKDQKLEPGKRIVVSGTHKLSDDDHVVLFLVGVFGGYYLQGPAVELLEDGKWEQSNCRPGRGINALVCIQVDNQGYERVIAWIKSKRFGKIEKSEVKQLPGYKQLDRVRVSLPDGE